MPLSSQQQQDISERIRQILKLDSKIIEKRKDIINGDTSPFLTSLLGENRTLMVKVGQSLQTTMGMSFYEQTSQLLGEEAGYKVELQKKVLGFISKDVIGFLQKLNSINYSPNRIDELTEIRRLCVNSKNDPDYGEIEYPDSTVDVYITTPSGKEILIDITTVKPNKKDFRILKEKTLRWSAYRMSQNPKVDVEAYFAIPYNPESLDPKSTDYSRFSNFYDRRDILVGNELWQKVSANQCNIIDLIEIFQDLGENMKSDIDKAFQNI
jgi:hypothetical protein